MLKENWWQTQQLDYTSLESVSINYCSRLFLKYPEGELSIKYPEGGKV